MIQIQIAHKLFFLKIPFKEGTEHFMGINLLIKKSYAGGV